MASGCAADGVVEEEVDSAVEPSEASTKDTGTDARPVDATVRDTSVPDTSRPDASNDATTDAADSGPLVSLPGEDFDPTAPKAGDPCPVGVPGE